MSRSPQFQVDGESFPLFSPEELGEKESPLERDLRERRLREAREREAIRWRCKACGELGAMRPGNDRYHVEVCKGGAA